MAVRITEQLAGKLADASFVHQLGKSILRDTNVWFDNPVPKNSPLSTPSGPETLHKPPPDVLYKIQQWRSMLSVPDTLRSLEVLDPSDHDIWVDALGRGSLAHVAVASWMERKPRDRLGRMRRY